MFEKIGEKLDIMDASLKKEVETLMRMYLVNARKEKGYSQRKTAREAVISYQHYSKIESGERGKGVSFMIFSRIAKVLDISLDDLFYLEREYRDQQDYDEEFNLYWF